LKLYKDKIWLEHKYVIEELSRKEIAKLGGCNSWTVGEWLKRHSIQTHPRKRGGVNKICEFCGTEFYVRPSLAKKQKFCSKSCAAKVNRKRSSLVELSCDFCRGKFKVALSRAKDGQRFCSRKCYAGWQKEHPINVKKAANSPRKNGIEIVCEWCKAIFKISPGRKTARFCSQDCYTDWRRSRPRLDLQDRTALSCEVCDKKFEVNAWQIENMERRFCSKECRGKWHSGTFVRKKASQWSGGWEIERQCEICGKSFLTARSRVEEGQGRFCSKDCQSVWHSGENHYRWLGGKSFEPYPPTFNKRFKQMIRERDNHTCLICGCPGEDVHHINYVKNDTNPGNCVLLCKICHGKTLGSREFWPNHLHGLMLERIMLQGIFL